MNVALFITLMLITAGFAAVSLLSVARRERHGRVLAPFYQIRRDLTDVVLSPIGTYSRREEEAAHFLLTMVSKIIIYYCTHKTEMFNIREVRRAIEKDLRHYKKSQDMVRARLADLPDTPVIRKAYTDFIIALANAFLANTPFIRTEIVLRLLRRDLAKQIANARRESDKVLHEVGGEFA